MNAVTTSIPALAHDAGVPPAPPETHQQAAHEEHIPLKRIVASPYNVRRKEPTGIEALADNILRTGGLLQNIVVHPMKVGAKKAQTFGVAAGERRRRALMLLLERGEIADDYPVRCLVVAVEDAVLMSATENEMREPMHPIDACDAYRVLVDTGRSVTEIADIYGVSEAVVQRRLKLARVSPKLVDLFRDGEIRLEQMQALALSDSHAEQETVWFESSAWDRDAHTLRRRLTRDEHSFLDNRIAQFVGLDAYEAAGGVVRRDLFSDQGAAWYTDQALMERTALAMLDAAAEPIRAAGWAWVEPVLTLDYNVRTQFVAVAPTEQAPTDEQKVEMDAITARLDAIAEQQDDESLDEDAYNALDEEGERLSTRYAEIEDSLAIYPPDVMAHAGVIITIERDGMVVYPGWHKRDDVTAEARDDESENESESGTTSSVSGAAIPTPAKGPHSEKLTLRLNARRTAAVAAALAQQPHVALATLVHALLLRDVAHDSSGCAVRIDWHDQTRNIERHAPELMDDLAYRMYAAQRTAWRGVIPNDSSSLLTWCIEQPAERLMLILAQYVAASIDGVAANEKGHAINALMPALGLNLADAWQPTKASYFDHVSKQRIVDIVSAAVSPSDGLRVAKLKKGDAATEAERLMAGRGWLPEHFVRAEVRTVKLGRLADPSDSNDDDDHDDESCVNEDDDDAAAQAAETEGMPVHIE